MDTRSEHLNLSGLVDGGNERSQSSSSLNYPLPSNTDLFLPALDDNLNVEPQLYSVEQNSSWKPVSSPFMVPGIYRKIDTNAKPVEQLRPSNVFLTASEPHGRIVRVSDFQKLYVCEQQLTDELNNNGQPRRVFPVKELQQNNIEVDKTVSKTIKRESAKTQKWDALSRLAFNILKLSSCDHSVVINRSRNEIVRTDKNTQQKDIYRFLSNDDLGVEPPLIEATGLTNPPTTKSKLGRPRKRVLEDDIVMAAETAVEPVKKACTTESLIEPKPNLTYSRFGRAIKPIKPVSLSPRPNLKEQTAYNTTDETRDTLNDIKDKDFTCNLNPSQLITQLPNSNDKNIAEESTPVPIATSSPTKRHVPPESICPTCKKIFLGRRLKRHFVDHPNHMKPIEIPIVINQQPNTPTDEISLFRFLVSKLQKSNLNEDQRADLFLHELNDLVEQLQLRSSRLIRNTSGLHLVTSRTARVLGIPEGQYALDMAAIDTTPEPEPSCLMNFEVNTLPVPSNNTRSLDYTALSLDDTLTDEAAQKLNLSAGGKLLPPSEESLLRAVDDFVPPTGITKLVVSTNLINQPNGVITTTSSSSTVDTIVPHYDHASDNAVEAVTMKTCNTGRQAQPILDLAVDFFQFNTNK